MLSRLCTLVFVTTSTCCAVLMHTYSALVVIAGTDYTTGNEHRTRHRSQPAYTVHSNQHVTSPASRQARPKPPQTAPLLACPSPSPPPRTVPRRVDLSRLVPISQVMPGTLLVPRRSSSNLHSPARLHRAYRSSSIRSSGRGVALHSPSRQLILR